jgi:nitroreductase
MSEILKVIRDRHSSRAPFDQGHAPSKRDLMQILEAARWAPTAHNMQNFEIVVVDDKKPLEELGNIESRISEDFLRENYQQLSFSEEELLQKKVGILGTVFPPSWRTPGDWGKVARESEPSTLDQTIKGSPMLLIVTYDPRKRAPASENDALGFMSLGCVMENMWLMAQELGISFQIMSVFGGNSVEQDVKKILEIPEYLRIAYAVRLGYPISKPSKLLRVRRDVEGFAHYNRFGKKGFV